MERETIIDEYRLDGDNACRISPSWGCNLFSWTVNGEEILYTPADYPAAAFKITGGGTPLLFPSVGRTWDQSGPKPVAGPWRLAGSEKVYQMPSHGILYQCGWRKTIEVRGEGYLRVGYEAVVPEAVIEESYPFAVGYSQRFTLRSGEVDLEAVLTNRGEGPAPAAFGYHPYFRISNAAREGVEARLPVRTRLGLTPETVLPTGETEPTDGVLRLEPDVYYDAAYVEPTGSRMSLLDARAGRAVHVDFDETFELFFAYAPDGADFFCIEPWTRGLGAFARLGTPGWEDGRDIPVLAPGETRHHRATFRVEPMAK